MREKDGVDCNLKGQQQKYTHRGEHTIFYVPKMPSQHRAPNRSDRNEGTPYLIAFSFPPILGVTTERREGEATTASTLSATRTPLKLVTPIGPVNADAHAADPTSAASVRVS